MVLGKPASHTVAPGAFIILVIRGTFPTAGGTSTKLEQPRVDAIFVIDVNKGDATPVLRRQSHRRNPVAEGNIHAAVLFRRRARIFFIAIVVVVAVDSFVLSSLLHVCGIGKVGRRVDRDATVWLGTLFLFAIFFWTYSLPCWRKVYEKLGRSTDERACVAPKRAKKIQNKAFRCRRCFVVHRCSTSRQVRL
eukprot:scaffold2353_cov167-Amphora_coffeaeformis.AAC.20